MRAAKTLSPADERMPAPLAISRRAVAITAGCAAAAITLAALTLLCLVRRAEIGNYPGDFVAILDGGYRISRGQWPHIDFAVPHGAWPLLQGWLALKLASVFAPFLTYQVTQWLTVLPAALYLATEQRSRWRACTLLIIAAVATLVPYVFDYQQPQGLNYFAGYNRLDTALVFLTFVWAATPRRRTWTEALVVAFLLLALLATKITGFVVGAGVVAFVACLSPVKRSLGLRASAILLFVLAVIQIATRLPLAYLGDILAMFAINRGGIAYALSSTALKSAPALAALTILGFAVLPRQGTKPAKGGRLLVRLRALRAPLLVVVLTVGTLAVESQAVGNLLLAAASALLFVPLPSRAARCISVPVAKAAVAFAVLGPWFGGALYDCALVATRQIPQSVRDPALERLLPRTLTTRESVAIAAETRRLESEADPPNALLTAQAAEIPAFVAMAQSVDAAATAAQRQGLVGPGMAVMTIGEIDFFARILGASPSRAINLWQAPGRTFPTQGGPELRHYLRNVDAAFMRVCDDDKAFTMLNAIFRPALEADFVRHNLTRCWTVWIRKPSA